MTTVNSSGPKVETSQLTTSQESSSMSTKTSNQLSDHPPSKPQRRRTSSENLKMEEAQASQDTNTHWSTRVNRPSAVKRHSSSLSLDMRDSIIDFRDQDGNYASACDHSLMEDDHKCFCKEKAASSQK